MKKDTINTFNEGMVKDLHPLTTPNNVLTDALNATLVTYNGNELVLQNDMGNTKISNAFLPAGYVPVGMKEHGGIIYVAAYNPKTKKGQIGSFPSPKQLWENEGWTVNSNGTAIDNVSISTSDFYNGDYISVETIKTSLFKYQNGFAREFHPGDKYTITIPSTVNTTLQNYVNEGKIKLQLGVIKKDGSIEIMADASEDWFLTPVVLEEPEIPEPDPETGETPEPEPVDEVPVQLANGASEVISRAKAGGVQKYPNPRVFNASSSGNLILIINIVTLDSFDLTREYELIEVNDEVEEGAEQTTHEEIQVTFKGQGTLNNDNVNNLGIYNKTTDTHSNAQGNLYITSGAQGSNGKYGTKSFEIYPELSYGYVNRMKSSGSIDFNRIRTSQGDFHEWRYFVTDQYIKIGWAYEFYNLGDKVQLNGIQMDLYDFVKPSTYPNNPDVSIIFTKEYYSGNFEDYIRFDQYNIMKGHIYVVRISQVLDSGLKTITHKMLYVSKLYNANYNSVYNNNEDVDFKKCVEFTAPTNAIEVSIGFDQDFVYRQSDTQKVNVKTPTDQSNATYMNMNQLTSSYYHQDTTEPTENNYITTVKNEYNGNLTIESKYVGLNSELIGIPNQTNLQSVLTGTTATATLNKDVDWSGPYLQGYSQVTVPSGSATVTSGSTQNNSKGFAINFNDYRVIQGKATEPISDPYDAVEYRPVYDPDDTRRFDVFYSAEVNNILCLHGSKDWDIRYGGTIVDNCVIEGAPVDSGYDDVGLTAANRAINANQPPTVNIFAGLHGQDASLRFDEGGVSRPSLNGWSCHDNEVDNSDNFLVTVWKFTDGNCHFVNLFSKRNWPANSSENWPRLDVMLRCFLSQIFIAQKVTKTATYITTDQNYYRYQDGKTTLNISISTGNTTKYNDIMLPYSGADSAIQNLPLYSPNGNDVLSYWKDTTAGHPGASDADLANLVNLIPKVNARVGSISLDPLEVEGNFNMDNIIKYYLGVSASTSGVMDTDPTIIKVVDMGTNGANNASNAAACYLSDNNKPKALPDGTYKWIGVPQLKNAGSMSTNPKNDTRDTIYDWKGGTWKFDVSLNRMFKTLAAVKGWKDLSNGEFNELLANHEEAVKETCPLASTGSDKRDWYIAGDWVEGKDRDAPDLYFGILASDKSLYKLNYLQS